MFSPRLSIPPAVATLVTLVAPRVLHAAWPSSPSQAVPLLGQDTVLEFTAVSDGTGGAIVLWGDARSGVRLELHVRRVGADRTSQRRLVVAK